MATYQEIRLPRSKLTTKLEAMCLKLDTQSVATVSFRDLFFNRPAKCDVTVKRLWVVGSYARGALTCGDLDVVVEFEFSSGLAPLSATLNKAFLGALPRVRLYPGTPDKNESGVAFSEALLVWERESDWKARIQAIPEVPTAGHFERLDDALPVSREHLGLPVDEADALVAAEKEGRIKMRFMAWEDLMVCARPPNPHEAWLKHFASYTSKSAQRMLPGIAAYMGLTQTEPGAGHAPTPLDDTGFRFRGHYIRATGRGVPVGLLDDLRFHRLALFLPWSSRWTNGVLIVERGPNHPLVTAFADMAAWGLWYTSSNEFSGSTFGWFPAAHSVDLFSTEEDARELCETFNSANLEEDESFEDLVVPQHVSGDTFLRLIAQADILAGVTDIPVNCRGQQQLKGRLNEYTDITPSDVKAALTCHGYSRP